jgi:hypothetical protein
MSEQTLERWKAAMLSGDFAAAWLISDRHLASESVRSTAPGRDGSPLWRGEPLGGKRILVRCHHGLGDTIQFIRFAAPLRRIARSVTVYSQPELVPVVATVTGVDRVLTLGCEIEDGAYDLQIEVMELAHALRVDACAIRRLPRYALPQLGLRPRGASSGPRNIGLVWRAGEWCSSRSVPAAMLSGLAALPNIRLCSLQCGPAAADAAMIPACNLSSNDAMRTAATLCGLDLLISVDTFPAHLAGALGVPVWLLLQHHCDWRWTQCANESVWYPTIRLFRQSREGDWQSVVAAIMARLRERTCRSRVG